MAEEEEKFRKRGQDKGMQLHVGSFINQSITISISFYEKYCCRPKVRPKVHLENKVI